MPETPDPKIRPEVRVGKSERPKHAYAELQVTSNFSFLRGGSHPEELVGRAAEVGCRAVALTDLHSLAGIVRAKIVAEETGIQLVVGNRLQLKAATGVLAPGSPAASISMLVYPTDRAAYGRLCRLLTKGKRRALKGECDLTLQDLLDHQEGLLAVLLPPPMPLITDEFQSAAELLRDTFTGDRLSVAAACLYDGRDRQRLEEVANFARGLHAPLVATNDVHYHIPERKPLQDVLTCIRLGCTLEQAGFALFANAERHIKGPDEMARLFRRYPGAIERTLLIAERAAFSMKELKYEYPAEICPPGKSMMDHLVELTWQGARERYPVQIPPTVHSRLEYEFALIKELKYPAYFLTVHDIVRFARSRGILCQGRGAAANSAVCYCLGITSVDPDSVDLLVERFISRERGEPPDIDIDFEHERREEVIQYIYAKYGRHRAALTAEVITYRRRSAIREVGKALGLSLDCVDRLAKAGDWWDKEIMTEDRLGSLGLDPRDRTLRQAIDLAGELLGFPRHLSQHVGGFVISHHPLEEIVPIENAAMPNRTIIEWDKDDIDEMGMLKVDVLGLGMMTCIRKAIDEVNQWNRGSKPPLQFDFFPLEDPAVYDMLCKADSLGVFQVESRAQMTMLPRLKPRCYYDLVIEVAIVRPGPIQGDMVHPYLRRRQNPNDIEYSSPAIQEVLKRTLGVPLFQEQAMKLVMVAAGFTAGEADGLRRAMAAWKRKGHLLQGYTEKILSGMAINGYKPAYAQRVVQQIKGFADYGFPESHAASFAHLVYVSAWLKCHHPAAFAAALINSQPMGFYQPAQIIRDARDHGVTVLPADIQFSNWDCRLEKCSEQEAPALRLGMRLTTGLREEDAARIAAAIARHGPFDSIPVLWRAAGVRIAALRQLAQADAFNSMGLDRQRALWQIMQLREDHLPLLELQEESPTVEMEPMIIAQRTSKEATLPPIPLHTRVIQDYTATGLSLKAHPVLFARPALDRLRVIPAVQLADERRHPHGSRVAVAGIVLVRQRPGTASGILFITLEDETGVANLVVHPNVYERYRAALRHSIAILVRGKVERQGQVIHVFVQHAEPLTPHQAATQVPSHSRDFH